MKWLNLLMGLVCLAMSLYNLRISSFIWFGVLLACAFLNFWCVVDKLKKEK